ncbi:hypothetical protein E4U12_004502 [Claviceps purpurea]|nr:hypothetical protein E4U12_004502 [Claviceps purpurea]
MPGIVIAVVCGGVVVNHYQNYSPPSSGRAAPILGTASPLLATYAMFVLPTNVLAASPSIAFITIQPSAPGVPQPIVVVALLLTCILCLLTMGAVIFVIRRRRSVVVKKVGFGEGEYYKS